MIVRNKKGSFSSDMSKYLPGGQPERRRYLSSKHYRREDNSNIQHIDNHRIYGFEMTD